MARGATIAYWSSDEGLEELRGLSGGTLTDIAKAIGITRATLDRWCKRNDAIRAVLYDAEQCAAVEREMYKICFERRYVVKHKKQVLDKNGDVKLLEEEKEVVLPADFRAQKYWMNNRNPDRWKERVEVKMEGGDAFTGVAMMPAVDELEDEREEQAPPLPKEG